MTNLRSDVLGGDVGNCGGVGGGGHLHPVAHRIKASS
jgi:hypothetical protein